MSGTDCATAVPAAPRPMTHAAASAADNFFKGDVAVIMICSASIRRMLSDLRAIGRAAGLQRVRGQFDPILAPEYFAVEHISRRAEHVGGQRILTVLLIGGADSVGSRTFHKLFAGKSGVVGEPGQYRGVGKIELIFPHRRKRA